MLKIVPEVLADAKSRGVCTVAQVAVFATGMACGRTNDKNNTKYKHALVIGFVI
jgi:hypothetical protein